ncbi:MAG: ABC transporter ATP-binding protein/permease [Candidatus Cloacimonetes bacterium]|nr:ABC transporter ATP-binding protein/permease [Candidatus Cloacimonadota bacterium]
MIKRFLKYYIPHKWLFVLALSVAMLSSAIVIIIPLLTRSLLSTHIPDKNIAVIIKYLVVILLAIMIKSLFTKIRVKWGHYLGVRMEYDMREDFFGHIQKLSFNYFDNTKTGHLMSRLSNDLNMIAEMAHHAPEDLLIAVVMLIGAFSVMFHIDPTLAGMTLLPLPIMIAWGMVYGGRMRQGFRLVRKKIADLNSSIENSVQGIREVKAYANETVELHRFNSVNTNFKDAKEYQYRLMSTFEAGMTFFTDFYMIWVIGVGCTLMFKGLIQIHDLIAFILFINYMLDPIKRLVNFMEQFQQGIASFERFVEVMNIEPEIEDKPNAVTPTTCKGDISVQKVSFHYPATEITVLDEVSVEIPAGKTIALVGESGAGKSTLIALIPRFYEVNSGKILFDGKDILDLTQRFLRQNIGIVQQNVFLFDTTIGDNILYGKPNATESEMITAAKNANIYDFIVSLPDGFDTLVGERGIKLSGGQKQRVAIARVFLKNPAFLIFDEATSSLDNESEAYIHQSMIELSKNRTTLIIAHRLSTVQNADLIYVLKKGKIIEQGTHRELISKETYYHTLYNKTLFE